MAPSSSRSLFATMKPSMDETKIHLPKCTSSMSADLSHCQRLGVPGSHAWPAAADTAAEVRPPATSAQIDRSNHAQASMAHRPATWAASSICVSRPRARLRLASAALVVVRPPMTVPNDSAAMTQGRLGSA